MLFHPEQTIGIFCKSFTKASERLKNVSTLMQMDVIKELFNFSFGFIPEAKTDRANKLEYNFKNKVTKEGNINAYGIKGSAVGDHLDVGIFDDFVDITDKASAAERKTTQMMLEENVNNVLNPESVAMFIGTPWHKLDAWTICPTPWKFDVYSTDILTESEIQEKRRSTTNVTFAANYELRHAISDDSEFTNPTFARWNYSIRTKVYGQLDAKFSGDHTNGLTFMAKKKDGRYQLFGYCFTENVKEKYNFILEKWRKHACGTLFIEENADKGFVADNLRKKGILVETYFEKTNKHVKITTYLKHLWDLIDIDPDTDPEYLNQILDYVEGSEPDDCPDSAASLIRQKFYTAANKEALWNY